MRALICLGLILSLPVAATGEVSDGELWVRVVDPGGRPLQKAHVWICEQDLRMGESQCGAQGTSDLGGWCALSGLRPGFGRYRLVVSKPGNASTIVDRVFITAGEQSLEVRLGTGVSISGKVRSETGQPVAGATVRLQLPGRTFQSGTDRYWFPETKTGSDGSFMLSKVAPGVHGILVRTSKGIGWRAGIRAPVEGVDIIVRPGVTVRGGFPSTSHELPMECQLNGVTVPAKFGFRPGPGGRYAVRHVPEGKYHLLAGRFSRMVVVGSEELSIDPSPGQTGCHHLRGRVTDEAGSAIHGASVQAVIRYRGRWTAYFLPYARSDPNGDFVFRGLRAPPDAPDAELALLATHQGSAGWLGLPKGEPPTDVEIRLHPTEASLRVHTYDALSGAPIEGARVLVAPEWQCHRPAQNTDGHGYASFTGFVDSSILPNEMPAPTMRQRVSVFGGYSRFPWRGFVRLEGTTELDVPLCPRPVLAGRVVDSDGRPISGLRVLCADGQADTNARGEFRMLGSRADSVFADLRWSRLARTDPTHFPALESYSGQPGVFVAPSLNRVPLRLKVGAEFEGSRVRISEMGDPSFGGNPLGFVDERGEVCLGSQFEGEYVAHVEIGGLSASPWRELGHFTLVDEGGGPATINLTSATDSTGPAGK